MKAAVVTVPGDSSAMEVKDIAIPDDLSDGEVLVKNAYSGVNFIDTYHRSGLYARDLPFTVGQEATGVVSKTTPAAEAQGIKEGDNVLYSNLQTYSEYSKVPWAKVLPMPAGVALDEACVVPVQGLTAHYLVHDSYPLRPGQWCLVHAAAGGTGQWVVRLAKRLGARVVATVGSEAKVAAAS